MLQEADYALTEGAFEGPAGRYKGDETLLVKFYKAPKFNQRKSHEAGRPIYDETDYISIMQPGNKDSIVIRPAMELDKQRFSQHWSKYQARQDDEQIEGTLLEDWPGVTRSLAEELKFFNVRTVEQLASISDSNGIKIMGINMLKEKATAYLEASETNAAAEQLSAANARIDELMAAVEALKNTPASAEVEDEED
jgi:hypothetical protein